MSHTCLLDPFSVVMLLAWLPFPMVEPRSFIALPSISHFFLSCPDNSYDTRDRASYLVCGGADAGEQKGVKTVHRSP